MVAGGCAAIVGSGWAASPKELPSVDLADPDAGSSAQPTASASSGGDAATFDGPVVTNLRGDYQARITVVDGTVTAVEALAAGTRDAQSVQINATAIPELAARVLAAQSADVDHVAGASFTSPGFLESVAAALDAAGL